MSARLFPIPERMEWQQAFLAAVLEKDRARVPILIQDARTKLVVRLDEIASQSFSHDEVEAIHDADYLLQGLQSSLSYRNDLED